MLSTVRAALISACCVASACSNATSTPDAPSPLADATAAADTLVLEDAHPRDASPVDAAPIDAAIEKDGGEDAGPEPDAGFDLRRDPGCPTNDAWLVLLHGVLRDQAGAPLPDAKAQMCVRTSRDEFFCIPPADTGPDGRFTVAVPDNIRCMRHATMRFLAPHTPRGATYCQIDLGAPDITVAEPYALFDTRAPRTLPPLGDSAAMRTVVFDDGLEIDMVPSRFFADYERLTAARVPLDHPGLCFLEGQAPFDGLYAFAPEADIEGRAPVRIPNTTMLAPNRRVKLFVLGSLGSILDDGTVVPAAEWAEVGTGQVSADGRTIEASGGVPCLSWLAYRAE